MGHIEEAIERAKRLQQGPGGDPLIPTRRGGVAPKVRLKPLQRYALDPATLKANRILSPVSSGGYLKAFRLLRTQVVQDLRVSQSRVLGVTSTQYGAGKTVTATNLAISIARQRNDAVFLVDLDLRRPRIADYLGMPKSFDGLVEYLLGDGPLNHHLWDVGIAGLTVLPTRGSAENSSELLTSLRMADAFAALRASSESAIIVLNLPPVLTGDDVLAVSPQIDSFLVVAASGDTKKQDLQRTLDLIDKSKPVSTVLTKATES
jgi:protein-tyrosine kinase